VSEPGGARRDRRTVGAVVAVVVVGLALAVPGVVGGPPPAVVWSVPLEALLAA